MKTVLLQAVALVALAAIATAQVPAGGEFRVNTYTTDFQVRARVATKADGDFVVVWKSNTQDGDRYGVFGQRFAASGAPRGGEFQINTYTTNNQNYPAVAVGSSGEFVVVWDSPLNYETNIQARRYDASGSAIGGEFQGNSFPTGSQFRAHVGRASDGRFAAAWASPDMDGSSFGIAARRFEASASPLGNDFVVNTYTTGSQSLSDIAVEPGGDFVVVWTDSNSGRDGSGTAVFGQRYDDAGNRLGSELQVNTYTTGNQGPPSVSVSAVGAFVVAWTSEVGDGDAHGVFARRFDASGNAVGNDFVVNTYTTGSQYMVVGGIAHDARGNFVVTWEGPGVGNVFDSFAQRFSASGARRGAEFRVNTYTTDNQRWPTIASDPVGNFVVTWAGEDGSNYGVFAQRFGGLRPTALRVDTGLNGILEPGDGNVDFRPTWQNISGAVQNPTGTLGSPGGPPNGVPAIDFPSNFYGGISNGASAEAQTYRVSVPAPSPRPVLHWDSTIVETIAPDVQGQQKQWVVHIGQSFADVSRNSGFYPFIETLLHNGVTAGCTSTTYCPGASTTREQVAVFVLLAKEGSGYVPPACTTPLFADVPASNPFCRWIEELARRAVVSGCGGGNYCPTSAVTREQMAVFVLRTLDPVLSPPACTTPIYNDVPASSGFCRWIEELTRRGVVGGCGGGNYCPTAPVTREQMAVFISATFGLTLYGP